MTKPSNILIPRKIFMLEELPNKDKCPKCKVNLKTEYLTYYFGILKSKNNVDTFFSGNSYGKICENCPIIAIDLAGFISSFNSEKDSNIIFFGILDVNKLPDNRNISELEDDELPLIPFLDNPDLLKKYQDKLILEKNQNVTHDYSKKITNNKSIMTISDNNLNNIDLIYLPPYEYKNLSIISISDTITNINKHLKEKYIDIEGKWSDFKHKDKRFHKVFSKTLYQVISIKSGKAKLYPLLNAPTNDIYLDVEEQISIASFLKQNDIISARLGREIYTTKLYFVNNVKIYPQELNNIIIDIINSTISKKWEVKLNIYIDALYKMFLKERNEEKSSQILNRMFEIYTTFPNESSRILAIFYEQMKKDKKIYSFLIDEFQNFYEMNDNVSRGEVEIILELFPIFIEQLEQHNADFESIELEILIVNLFLLNNSKKVSEYFPRLVQWLLRLPLDKKDILSHWFVDISSINQMLIHNHIKQIIDLGIIDENVLAIIRNLSDYSSELIIDLIPEILRELTKEDDFQNEYLDEIIINFLKQNSRILKSFKDKVIAYYERSPNKILKNEILELLRSNK